MGEKDMAYLRKRFEEKMKELGWVDSAFEHDEHGYVMMDIAIRFSGFLKGYEAAVEDREVKRKEHPPGALYDLSYKIEGER